MLFLSRDEFMQFFNSKKQKCIDIWSEYDSDERIIALAFLIGTPLLCVIYVVSDKRDGLQPVFAIMMQFIALTLASVAATIAYRNYRRKSGNQISNIFFGDKSEIKSVLLQNEKDKAVTIFAIDVLLESKDIVRIFTLFQSEKPIILSAFESRHIYLDDVHSYEGRNPKNFDFTKMSESYCITTNGKVPLNQLNITELSDKYMNDHNLLQGYKIIYKPEKYKIGFVDHRARYWLYFRESKQGAILGTSDYVDHVLTGLVEDGRFYITNESLKYIEENIENYLQSILKSIHDKPLNSTEYEKYSLDMTIPYNVVDALKSDLQEKLKSSSTIRFQRVEQILFHKGL